MKGGDLWNFKLCQELLLTQLPAESEDLPGTERTQRGKFKFSLEALTF
jgi:hypothetical protein